MRFREGEQLLKVTQLIMLRWTFLYYLYFPPTVLCWFPGQTAELGIERQTNVQPPTQLPIGAVREEGLTGHRRLHKS